MKSSTSINSAAMVHTAVAHASRLERLPTEILEMIFFDCLNLSLPQASLVLGRALSSFYVKTRLFEIAFSFDRGYSCQLSHIERLEDLFPLSVEIGRFQSEILKAKWVNADFFRRYIPIYLERTISALSQGNELPVFVHRPVLVTNQDEVPKRVVKKRACPIPASSTDRHKVLARLFRKQIKMLDVTLLFLDHMPVQIHLADPDDRIWKWVDSDGSPILEDDYDVSYSNQSSEVRSMLHCYGASIPAKFLGGPWTKDQCHIVAMLSEAGALIDTADPATCVIAMQGFFHALKERNLQIIRYMLRSLEVGPEYLVYAVLYLGCPKAICESLIRRGQWHWDNVHCRILEAWADFKAVDGNYRGWWLLDTMGRYPGRTLVDMEEYIYIAPKDPNSSPGSFELINPALLVDSKTCSDKVSPWWVEWLSLELIYLTFGKDECDEPPRESESSSSESLKVVSSDLEGDQYDDPPQEPNSSSSASWDMLPFGLESAQHDDPPHEPNS